MTSSGRKRGIRRSAAGGAWLALAAAGCGGGSPSPLGDLATVQVAIREAPADASCLRIVGVGAQTTARTFDLKVGQTTVFTLGGLPTGATVFTADAVDTACAMADFSTPTYTSAQVPVALQPGANPEITLVMSRRSSLRVGVDFPGDERGKWVSIDGSPPGTPVGVKLDPAASSASRSVFDIQVHGLFLQKKQGPDGTEYQQVSVPGMGTAGEIGSPDLPVHRLELAVPPDARLVSATVAVSDTFGLDGMVPWPQPTPEKDHERGEPEVFTKNEQVYATASCPVIGTATASAPSPRLDSIQGTQVDVVPTCWDAKSSKLSVATAFRLTVDHPGKFPAEDGRITQERALVAEKTFSNWATVGPAIATELFIFTGDFLFLYPSGYKDELQPLIDQKKSRGFKVVEQLLAPSGNTCASVRSQIQTWYAGLPAWRDKYAILVGDVDKIPLCSAPTGVPTDDFYGDVDGGGTNDLNEEVYVGRLSVNNEADAANQVQKILQYSDAPEAFFNYGTALLVAHKENAPGKYVGAHESVRTASYSHPPVFSTLYGHIAGVDDADVSAAINTGFGLVAYRGHGNETAWTGWNTYSEYYDTADVSALANAPARVPVIWSFACTNSDLTSSDSIAETWMATTARAVSHYGATVPSWTEQNHVLDRKMFKAVYDQGLTTQGQAIEWGEAQLVAEKGTADSNAWMYLLLGDPEMRIRRGRVFPFVIKTPILVSTCPTGGCELDLEIVDDSGKPIPGVLVSLWKGGEKQDEVQDNRYTDKAGLARIPAAPQTRGPLLVSVRDLQGNSATKTIIVQ